LNISNETSQTLIKQGQGNIVNSGNTANPSNNANTPNACSLGFSGYSPAKERIERKERITPVINNILKDLNDNSQNSQFKDKSTEKYNENYRKIDKYDSPEQKNKDFRHNSTSPAKIREKQLLGPNFQVKKASVLNFSVRPETILAKSNSKENLEVIERNKEKRMSLKEEKEKEITIQDKDDKDKDLLRKEVKQNTNNHMSVRTNSVEMLNKKNFSLFKKENDKIEKIDLIPSSESTRVKESTKEPGRELCKESNKESGKESGKESKKSSSLQRTKKVSITNDTNLLYTKIEKNINTKSELINPKEKIKRNIDNDNDENELCNIEFNEMKR